MTESMKKYLAESAEKARLVETYRASVKPATKEQLAALAAEIRLPVEKYVKAVESLAYACRASKELKKAILLEGQDEATLRAEMYNILHMEVKNRPDSGGDSFFNMKHQD